MESEQDGRGQAVRYVINSCDRDNVHLVCGPVKDKVGEYKTVAECVDIRVARILCRVLNKGTVMKTPKRGL
jgi:hypothetical protein